MITEAIDLISKLDELEERGIDVRATREKLYKLSMQDDLTDIRREVDELLTTVKI